MIGLEMLLALGLVVFLASGWVSQGFPSSLNLLESGRIPAFVRMSCQNQGTICPLDLIIGGCLGHTQDSVMTRHVGATKGIGMWWLVKS